MIRVLAAALVFAFAARAGEPEPATDRPGARTAVPSNGVDGGPRRGAFAEASVGVFATVGGSRALSSAQPYLGLTAGRDLGKAASLFASLGIGASSNSCFQAAPATGNCLAADSFGATFLEVGASYGASIIPRILLSGKAMGGMTLFSPGPFTRKDGSSVPDQLIAPHLGAGIGLDYDTHLDHFTVGLDALLRYSLVARPDGAGKGGIASLALLPRIRYVF